MRAALHVHLARAAAHVQRAGQQTAERGEADQAGRGGGGGEESAENRTSETAKEGG